MGQSASIVKNDNYLITYEKENYVSIIDLCKNNEIKKNNKNNKITNINNINTNFNCPNLHLNCMDERCWW